MSIFRKKSARPQSTSGLTASGTIPLRNKLSFKMSFRVGLLILVILASMILTISYSVSRMVTQNVDANIALIAKQNANLVADYLNAMQTRANSLAATISSFENLDIEQDEMKTLIQDVMEGVLTDDRIFSVYSAWEPNSFFADTPDGLSFYYYRDGNSIKIDILNDYQVYKDGDYYAASKETLKPHITEPYEYTLTNGDTIWLVTISNPIISESGEFVGVTNCDVKADTINGLSYETGGFESSYSYILSNQGFYLANTGHPEKVGTVFGSDLKTGEDADMVQEVLSTVENGKQMKSVRNNIDTGEKSQIIYMPLNILDMDKPLSSVFVVSEAEAFSGVYNIILLIGLLSLAAFVVLTLSVALLTSKSLRPLSGIMKLAEDMKNGNLNTNIQTKAKDEFGYLSEAFRETSLVLKAYVSEISELLETLASGDLRISIKNNYVGDFEPIKGALLEISKSLSQTLYLIDIAADQVNSGASQVAAAAQDLASGAAQQAATIEELDSSISVVAKQARENAENVRESTKYVELASEEMRQGDAQMNKLIHTMKEVGEASDKIAGITKTIEDIAFQTNILALNAAVEAARAGAAGKGFSVVAEEVRNLASKSSEAAKQTGLLIDQSSNKVSEGIQATEKTAKILQDAVGQVARIDEITRMIEAASSEQAGAIEQITQGISQVSSVVQTNAATAEESSASSEELSAQARTLREEVNKFKLAAGD